MKTSKKNVAIATIVALIIIQGMVTYFDAKIMLSALIIWQIIVGFLWTKVINDFFKKEKIEGILVAYLVISNIIWIRSFFPSLLVWNLWTAGYLFVISLPLIFLIKEEEWGDCILLILLAINLFPILGFIPFWGTSSVWGVFLLIVAGIASSLTKRFYSWRWNGQTIYIIHNKDTFVIIVGMVTVVPLLLSVISTSIQYWNTAWVVLQVLIALVIITGISFLVFKFGIQRPKERKERKLSNEKSEKQKREFQELVEQLKSDDFTDWKRVYSVFRYRPFGSSVPKELLLKENQIFCEISHQKREIRFNPDVVCYTCSKWKKFQTNTMDDEILLHFKKCMEKSLSFLNGTEDYKGYTPLIQLLNENGVKI